MFSLILGATSTIEDCLNNCKFITKNQDATYDLKIRHKYYGQIQMGLATLNLKYCYLVLYASFDDTLKILTVEQDPKFAENMLIQIKQQYFRRMLHTICEHTNSVV